MQNILHPLRELAALVSSQASLEILPGTLEDWITAEIAKGCKPPPSPDFPFLYSDGNLGVPIKVLYKLYLTAVNLFKTSKSVPDICRISTCVMVLANPAHQTALNARKRLVQNNDLAPKEELEFIEAIFRGSGDCARQSILWDYRRWLLKRIYVTHLHFHQHSPSLHWTTSADLQPLPDIPPDAISEELSIVRRACEAHPRNYHAWTHWHFIVDAVYAKVSVDFASLSAYVAILAKERDLLTNWVNHHVSDHSSMHRLCNLSQLAADLELRYPLYYTVDKSSSLVAHAMSLITSYPTHESLWMYLRGAATLLPADGQKEVVRLIKASSFSQSPLAQRFVNWLGMQARFYRIYASSVDYLSGLQR